MAGNCLGFLDVNSSDLQTRKRSSYKSVFIEMVSKGMNGASVLLQWGLV